jgi:hypothetical protein
VRWSDGEADRPGWSQDISEGGIGFVTRALSAPRPGQRVRVALELDDRHEWPVDSEATVVRCDPGPHGLYAVGLKLSQPFMDWPDA